MIKKIYAIMLLNSFIQLSAGVGSSKPVKKFENPDRIIIGNMQGGLRGKFTKDAHMIEGSPFLTRTNILAARVIIQELRAKQDEQDQKAQFEMAYVGILCRQEKEKTQLQSITALSAAGFAYSLTSMVLAQSPEDAELKKYRAELAKELEAESVSKKNVSNRSRKAKARNARVQALKKDVAAHKKS